jgi:hypothetical protein
MGQCTIEDGIEYAKQFLMDNADPVKLLSNLHKMGFTDKQSKTMVLWAHMAVSDSQPIDYYPDSAS